MHPRIDGTEPGWRALTADENLVNVHYLDQDRDTVVRVLDDDTIRMELSTDQFLIYRRCSDTNRLIGRWKLDRDRSDSVPDLAPISIFEFTKDEWRLEAKDQSAPRPASVTYEVDCDVVHLANL